GRRNGAVFGRLVGSRLNARAPSIGAGKPSHGKFDAIAGKLAPGFDLRHIGGLGKAAKYLTRLFPRLLARQREGLAPESVARRRAQRFGRAASDVGGTTAGGPDAPPPQCNAERGTERVERAWDRARGFGARGGPGRPPHRRSGPLPRHLREIRGRSTPPPPPPAPRRGRVPSARRAP